MKAPFFLIVILALSLQNLSAQSRPGTSKNKPNTILLPNGWSLSPAGRQLPLGDFPLNAALSPDGRLLAVTNNGVGKQLIHLFDTKREKLLDTAIVGKAWYGLAFGSNGKRLYASGGNDNWVIVYSVQNERLLRDTVIRLGAPWPNKIWVGSIAVDDARNLLYVCGREDSTLYVCNTENFQVEKRIKLESEPYCCAISPGGDLYISLWSARKVGVLGLADLKRKKDIAAGLHPNELIFTKNGRIMYVANALDNSVSVIDVQTGKELEVLNAALFPDAPNGSSTNGLALSEDEKTLYIANADNNCLAVFDVGKPGAGRALGFIPTAWYPTSVRVVGKKIFVTNGKGGSSAANPDGPQPIYTAEEHRGGQYIGALFLGSLSVIDAPKPQQLKQYSTQVYQNTPYSKAKERLAEGEPGNPIPMKVGDPSPIKYVFYIVKENRTYDQVLSDVPGGNGDTTLLLFGEKITPNQHALVREFVLLDNFYVNAEVSADGHNWSMGAYATDYVEKTWPTEYGGRHGHYDYEGTRELARPKGGYIWDNCARNNVSYRTYGEFADDYKANYKTLEGHICPNYSSWDMNIQDIERERVWEHDFDSLVAIGRVPQFNTVRFGNDHTSGLYKGAYTPFAAVADNDLAVGRFVAHLSQSPIWAESVVFILEDDAQDGPDHVDAHRSTAYLAGPFVKRGLIDHTMYTTASMLRTMELILGMPPMSQYDAGATPMWRCFTAEKNLAPFQLRPNQVSLDARNTAVNDLSRRSETFNLARLDAVPERAFNEVLWKGIKGEQSDMPAPRRAAWIKESEEETED